MTDRRLAGMLKFLRREAGPPDLVSDGELLSRYVASRDEAAFELLVRRHGPLVFGTARRVLGDEHAAEDVFQATFLALARKANSLRHRDAVAGWLHQVALRAALRSRPKSMIARPAGYSDDASKDAELTELRAVLDEEVARLPERQRLAVVLCYLGGKTAEEAAGQLGCPRGTVLSRLAAARERLQRRLTRRGYGLPAAGIAALWAGESAPAISSHLIALTLRTAGPAVVRLTEGVLQAMVMTKLKAVTAVVLMTGAVGIGVGAWADGPGPGDAKAAAAPPAKKADEPAAKPPVEPTRKELVERYQKLAVNHINERRADVEQTEKIRWESQTLRQEQEFWAKEIERLQSDFVRLQVTIRKNKMLVERKIINPQAIGESEFEATVVETLLAEFRHENSNRLLRLREADREIRQHDELDRLREKLHEFELDEIKRLLK